MASEGAFLARTGVGKGVFPKAGTCPKGSSSIKAIADAYKCYYMQLFFLGLITERPFFLPAGTPRILRPTGFGVSSYRLDTSDGVSPFKAMAANRPFGAAVVSGHGEAQISKTSSNTILV